MRLDELWRIAGDRAARYLTAAVLTTACAAALLVNGISYLVQVGPPQSLPVLPALFGVAIGVGLLTATVWGSLTQSVDPQRLNIRTLHTPAGRRRLAVGLAFGIAGWLGGGLAGWLVGWLGGGLALGLVVGLAVGLEVRPAAIDLPHRLVSQGLAHAATRLALGLAAGLAGGLAGGIAGGLGGGLTFGFVIGLAFVSNSPWPRYAVACLLLARRDELPPRPAAFLDWAYDAGLVRLSGIAVQFRHREFQSWLTTHGKEFKPPKPPSPSRARNFGPDGDNDQIILIRALARPFRRTLQRNH
ncbi:MAG: hypothetical protein M3460_24610 [Actinomycetota bacterium]|nr:hypothetical protein [Actinomycetota bacterium]